MWAAPAVLSVAGASAQTSPPPDTCDCRSSAYGLSVRIPLLGINQTLGVGGCVAKVSLGAAGVATVKATAVCGNQASQGGTCTARASVATLDVVVADPTPFSSPKLRLSATVLTSDAAASCDPCGTTGDSSIASLLVNDITIDGDTLTCNVDVLGLGLVIFNEQVCTGGSLSVNALHIRVPNVIDLVVAHSEAGATDCPCAACA